MNKKNNIAAMLFAVVAMYFSVYSEAASITAGISGGSFYFGTGGAAAGGIAAALCNIASWFQGGIGQAIASLAIIFLGISAFFGKTTWGTALMFAVGIFAIFGSGQIVSAIVNGVGGDGLAVSVGPGGLGISFNSGGGC